MPLGELEPLETVQRKVQDYYSERITGSQSCCATDAKTERVGGLEVPTYGCGTPTAFAAFKGGETVLDLGSGAGLDCFRAAEAVGESGQVIGVDMTPALLARARAGAAQLELGNVEFRQGYIEALPVETASMDVVLSNCVINLSGDKTAVLLEAFRVLRAGGRLIVSDIVRVGKPPSEISDEGWCSCSDGAETVAAYRARLQAVGFAAISFSGDAPAEGTYSARIEASKPAIRAALPSDRQAVEALLSGAELPTAGLEQTELLVLEENGILVGTVGFEPYGTVAGNVVLLRSLAVLPRRRGAGLARALLVAVFDRLRTRGVTAAYGLTTTIPDLLLRLGFAEVRRDALPEALSGSAQVQGPQACSSTARVFQRHLLPQAERR